MSCTQLKENLTFRQSLLNINANICHCQTTYWFFLKKILIINFFREVSLFTVPTWSSDSIWYKSVLGSHWATYPVNKKHKPNVMLNSSFKKKQKNKRLSLWQTPLMVTLQLTGDIFTAHLTSHQISFPILMGITSLILTWTLLK